MANQTRIQLRRGYSIGYTGPMIGGIPTGVSGTWAVGTSLAPGEIGFELDTGKFKIGTNVSGIMISGINSVHVDDLIWGIDSVGLDGYLDQYLFDCGLPNPGPPISGEVVE